MEGMLQHAIVFAGAPACTAASAISCAALSVHFLADGCGEKMIAFLALTAIIALKIAVDVGFVDGTIPITKPTGSAILMIPVAGSSSRIPDVFMFLID